MKVRYFIFLLGAVSLILVSLDQAGLSSGPRSLAEGLISPFQIGWYRLTQTLSKEAEMLSQIGSLRSDNLKLREENDQLKANLGDLQEVKKDNDLLRDQLGSSLYRKFNLLDAQTLGFLPSLGTKELLLDRGSLDGARIGQVVLSGNIVLGKISGVTADRSMLRLLTDPSSKLIATSSQGAKGLLIGQFQSSLKLTKVLKDEKLSVGDVVFTGGEEDWPKNLVIGEVTRVDRREDELFQEAEVRPLSAYDRLEIVFIITGHK